VAGKLLFTGYSLAPGDVVTGQNLPLYTVTFTGTTAGKGLTLDLDDTSDSFSMAPASGPSTNIYALQLLDKTGVSVIDAPTISSTNIAGPYVTGIEQQFDVTLNNPASGGVYTNVLAHFTIANTTLAQIYSFTYFDAGSSTWQTLPLSQVGPDLVGDYGPAAGFPMSAPYNATAQFRIVFMKAGSYNVGITLVDLTTVPNTTLATFNATAVVNGDFTVTGTVSMQGRTVRSGVPVTLTKVGLPGFGPYSAISIDVISNNLTFTLVGGGTYTITTNQPRYLDVTADLGKTTTVTAATTISPLELKGGDANDDNVIGLGDASIIGAQYGQTGADKNGDVNFSNKVDIFDLAMVGGNFGLTSSLAYASWAP
jgi:hypothetical protein